MAPRPSDIKAVAALLVEGAETPEVLARAVIDKVDELRAERGGFCIITEAGIDGQVAFTAFGPFSTQNQAVKAVERGLIPEVTVGARWRWGRMYSDGYLRARFSRADTPPADKQVIDAKKYPHMSDPHLKDPIEIKVYNRKTNTWKTVYKKRGAA